jgi:acyl-CoA thioesterase I
MAGAAMAVLVGVLSLVLSGGASGDVAAHCARLSAQSQVRERLVTGHGARVVVIGDSYSVGLGLRDPAASWPSRLAGRVHVYGFSGSGFSARSSRCPRVAYADREPRALRDGADLVVFEGGLNDYDQPASAVRTGFRSLMARLRGHRVLVVGPPAAPSRAASARCVDALLRDESARARVDYLPMTSHTFSYLDDGLHLTPAGHRAFGNLIRVALED